MAMMALGAHVQHIFQILALDSLFLFTYDLFIYNTFALIIKLSYSQLHTCSTT